MNPSRFAVLALVFVVASCRPRPAPPVVFEAAPHRLGALDSGDPRLSVRASGSMAVLVTQRRAEGGTDVLIYHSHGGDDYDGGTRLNVTPGDVASHAESSPQFIAGPGMRLCAAWLGAGRGGPAGIELACAKHGDRFAEPVRIDTGATTAPSFFASGVVADGTIVLVWFASADGDGRPGTAQLWMTTTRDGQRFSPPRRIAGDVCPCCRPALASDGDTLFLVWRRVTTDGSRDIVLVRSDDDGGSWSTPQPVAIDGWRIDGCPHSGPAAQVADGRLLIAWMSGADDQQRLFWTSSADGGRHFAPRARAGAGLVEPNHPALAFVGTRAFVTFEARDSREADGWGPKRAYLEELATGARSAVPMAESAGYVTAAALSPDALALAWTNLSSGHAQAMVSRARLLAR